MRRLCLATTVGALLTFTAIAGPATAATPKRSSSKIRLSTKTTTTKLANGATRIHYVYGPVHIAPGQNSIFIEPNDLKPKVDGYVTRFAPNLILQDGTIPRVDQIHLHHAVWLVNRAPTWGAGEEKTTAAAPKGYGWEYKTSDEWLMNHMIHDLLPTPETVFITYDIDFIPKTSPAAANLIPVRTQWMDVVGGGYPVFDAIKGTGTGPANKRKYTYPDDDPTAYGGKGGYQANQWTVTKPSTLVGTAGHLHPGGLYTDLKVTRDGVTKTIFHSVAKYWEPAGAVSWDVSMTATDLNGWKVNVKPGDVVSVHATYDTSKASWYESMGIMATEVADGYHGVDPFTDKVKTTGKVTHGPLAENRNHGGGPAGLPNPLKLLDGPVVDGKQVLIDGFIYKQGNLSGTGTAGMPPVIHQGGTFTFVNNDAPPGLVGQIYSTAGKLPIYHTITSCKQPCNKATGIAYPLANGPVTFDSGELGYGPAGFTAAAQRNTWDVPKDLPKGTYTYFCRVHPFMRGSFRVVGRKL